ncbi:hypothetical protein DDD_0640 [Nonlabens dokdonensis DSW-6]|uniref:Uncharacterized protein n=1 Tax=Nonlabens dokdonensis (strain DSM 17205 / KCTC 12402 / DSW-6) TaxID=592029 RepID=L7W7L2_NONDD|nr:hypothetical protein DDD_0640 [Nonlabens dokdonensis DSW-6]
MIGFLNDVTKLLYFYLSINKAIVLFITISISFNNCFQKRIDNDLAFAKAESQQSINIKI